MSDKFILDEHGNPIYEPDMLKWAKWFETAERIVQQDVLANGVRVSTVFLGLDHSFGHGPPVLWETMIFGGPHDRYQERYSTLKQAVAGHAMALRMAVGKFH